MARKTVWKTTITIELEVPEDHDDVHQRPRITWEGQEEDGEPCKGNSIKVDSGLEVINMLSGDLMQFLVEALPEWDAKIEVSEEARYKHAFVKTL